MQILLVVIFIAFVEYRFPLHLDLFPLLGLPRFQSFPTVLCLRKCLTALTALPCLRSRFSSWPPT